MRTRIPILRKVPAGAVWTSTVTAMLAMIATLNLVPPVSRGFETTGYVLASRQRLTNLAAQPQLDRQTRIVAIQPMGQPSETPRVPGLGGPRAKVGSHRITDVWIARVQCRGPEPLSAQALQAHFSDASNSPVTLHPDSSISRKRRALWWQMEANQHSIRVAQEASSKSNATSNRVGESDTFLASSKIGPAEESSEMIRRLELDFEKALEEIRELDVEAERLIELSQGQLQVARQLETHRLPSQVSLSFGLVVLSIGCASFALVVGLYIKIMGKRFNDSHAICKRLAQVGIKHLGSLPALAKHETKPTEHTTGMTTLRIWTKFCELSIMLLLVVAGGRYMTDDQWRTSLSNDFLFAIAHLFQVF